MQRLTTEFVDFLKQDDWNYALEEGEESNSISFNHTGQNGKLRVTVHFQAARPEYLCIYSKLEVTVPEHKLHQAAEYLHRANYGLMVGNFELDFRDGEVRYKSSVNLEGAVVTAVCYRNLLHANLSTAHRYYPALMKMIWSDDLTPADAIELIEGGA